MGFTHNGQRRGSWREQLIPESKWALTTSAIALIEKINKKKKTKFKDFHSIDLKIENIKERKLIPHIKKKLGTMSKTDLEGRDYFCYKSYIGDSISYLDLILLPVNEWNTNMRALIFLFSLNCQNEKRKIMKTRNLCKAIKPFKCRRILESENKCFPSDSSHDFFTSVLFLFTFT